LRELADLPEPPVNLDIEEARLEASALFGKSEESAND
jgi:segregation and condensation protein B